MSVTKDFDAMLAERIGTRPTFKVAGQEFTLRAKLAFARWSKLVAQMRSDAEGDQIAVMVKFFDTVLIRDDRSRFRELLEGDDDTDDEDGVVDMSQLDAITDWVMEYYTGKLQSSSSGSSIGSNGTGLSPNVVSLNTRSTVG